jgi:hypothetical protein
MVVEFTEKDHEIVLDQHETLANEMDEQIQNMVAQVKACNGNVAGLLREWVEVEDSVVVRQLIGEEVAAQMDTSRMVQLLLDENSESDSDDEDDEPKEMTRDDLNEVVAHAKAAAFYCKAAGGPFSQLETMYTDSIYTAYKLYRRQEEAKKATKKLKERDIRQFFGAKK